ncbi:related to scytalone dehydratase [Ramularia collo-cygni]|uniref:Related to scytalone dehydratase n=1 Tax=Ramularia collo-cygni TaxID=112498 RepID=A0A2D3UMM4_9PEZI|nr:related to scytalone dehydratase [Ramularia collo-cygni]CZT15481.1 related to scytalone dehydratase [Ramularia collo-cygni]
MTETSSKVASYEDVQLCEAALFEWAESYDTKDWDRLAKCIAPTLYIDYRTVMGKIWEEMPAKDFLGMASDGHFLGNARIKTQHLVGATKWTRISDTEITGLHQMRVAHQKYKDDALTEVLHKGHAHGKSTIQYRKVDGVWKFAGLTPDIRWHEYNVDKIFGPE